MQQCADKKSASFITKFRLHRQAWQGGCVPIGRPKWRKRFQQNRVVSQKKNMNSKDQLMQARELGSAAFHAGKPYSPVKDKDFMAFLQSCGRRSVGAAPAGEAPMLTLLLAWMSRWAEEARLLAAPPILAALPPAASGALGAEQDQVTFPPASSMRLPSVFKVAVPENTDGASRQSVSTGA